MSRHVRDCRRVEHRIASRKTAVDRAAAEFVRDNGKVAGVGYRSLAKKYAINQPELRAAVYALTRPDTDSDWDSDSDDE